MSLFQCDKCGCYENTACSSGTHSFLHNSAAENERSVEAMKSAKERLGLNPNQSFGRYCSACSPFWFTSDGQYGVGTNPNPTKEKGDGVWHERFPRDFYPIGSMETDRNGNLQQKKSIVGMPLPKVSA